MIYFMYYNCVFSTRGNQYELNAGSKAGICLKNAEKCEDIAEKDELISDD